jgi:phytoene desaturase
MKRVAVIGAGLGGLAASIRLARAGYRVTVLEKNGRVGGKMHVFEAGGYRFDTGPTLLTMPFVLDELFAAAGRNREDDLELVPCQPLCRYSWPDGTTLDATTDPEAMEREVRRISPGDAGQFARFMARGERIYRAGAGPFLFTPFMSLRLTGLLAQARKAGAILKIDAMRTMDRAVSASFRDERLRQLFNRFATYNGSSPYLSPATLQIIPYVEFAFGGWYVRGGMYRVAEVLARIAGDLGVEIRTGLPVTRIVTSGGRATGVLDALGELHGADAVLCNADALYARESLLAGAGKTGPLRAEPSMAGFVMLLGVRKLFPQLAQHTILFSADYRQEFEAIIRRRVPPEDPTVYLSVSSLQDRHHAPQGGSNLFVLVNAPALHGAFDWEQRAKPYRDLVLARMRRQGIEIGEEEIEVERVITPKEFAGMYNAHRGSIYGTSSNGRMAAFVRPPNRSREVRNLYFAGGSAHPGGGIPLVLLSGKLASDLLREDLG